MVLIEVILIYLSICKITNCEKDSSSIPIVINTWPFIEAGEKAWEVLFSGNSALDAVEVGCSTCELLQCDGTVGFGGSPDENAESTLDAMIIDGETHDIGAVANMREIKQAISVARMVLERTDHTMLVGSLATDFAVMMGFKKENLSTAESVRIYDQWSKQNCQPNFWKNVNPDPKTSCGPYKPVPLYEQYSNAKKNTPIFTHKSNENYYSHDTIGMIAIDKNEHIAAGTSTNGARHKIPGRVGDSPIPGSGAYVDKHVGGSAATGDGDVMMRFLPSLITVEFMRQYSPSTSAKLALKRIVEFYPKFSGAVIALKIDGNYGAACVNIPNDVFKYTVGSRSKVDIKQEKCLDVAALSSFTENSII